MVVSKKTERRLFAGIVAVGVMLLAFGVVATGIYPPAQSSVAAPTCTQANAEAAETIAWDTRQAAEASRSDAWYAGEAAEDCGDATYANPFCECAKTCLTNSAYASKMAAADAAYANGIAQRDAGHADYNAGVANMQYPYDYCQAITDFYNANDHYANAESYYMDAEALYNEAKAICDSCKDCCLSGGPGGGSRVADDCGCDGKEPSTEGTVSVLEN